MRVSYWEMETNMDEGYGKQFEELQQTIEALMTRLDALSARVGELEGQENAIPAPLKREPNPSTPSTPPPHPPPPIEVPVPSTGPPSSLVGDAHASTTTDRRIAKREAFYRTQQNQKYQMSRVPSPKPRKEPFDFRKFEWLLGTRGLALLGMLIVVVGVGMFLKLAVDEGWIAAIPPTIRCAGSAVFGLALVCVGELLRRRINPLASSGTTGAGISVVYTSILAATKLYPLLDPSVAFVLLALTTFVGIGLGSLSNRVMLAMFSLIGAFLAPVLLSTGEPSFVALPLYLLALLTLGLVLSGWRGGAYAHVRRLAWWGTGIIGTLWLGDMYDQAPTSSLVFVSLVWVMTVGELIVSARFLGRLRDGTRWDPGSRAGFLVDDTGEKTFDPRSLFSPEARWINALFGVSVWSVVSSALTIRALSPGLEYIAPLAFALASALLAYVVLRLRREGDSGLFAEHGTPRSALIAAMSINAAMLGVATVATALGGWVQVLAWVMLGLGAIETARRIRFRAVGLFGFALVCVAVARLFTLDLIVHLDADPSLTLLRLAFTAWSLQIVLVAGVCAVACWRSRYRIEARLAGCAALWIAGASLIHPESSLDSLGSALLVLAAIGAWITVVAKVPWVRLNAYTLAAIAMCIAVFGQFGLDLDSNLLVHISPISMLIAGLCWAAIAALPGARFDVRSVSAALGVISGAFVVAKIEDWIGAPEALLAGAIYSGGVIVLGLRLVRWSLVEIATVLLVTVTIAWSAQQITLGVDTLDGIPIAHLGFASAILLVVFAIWGGRLLWRIELADDAPEGITKARHQLAAMSFALGWMLLLASTSIEAVRSARLMFTEGAASGASVSIWWSLFAISSVSLGFRIGPPLRWAGLGLLGVVAIKVLFIDTVTLSQPARIVASISVGLVIIAAGVLYARLVDVVKPNGNSTEEPEEDRDEDLDEDPAPNLD
jgi:Predicted membrane protein (DUF2339)